MSEYIPSKLDFVEMTDSQEVVDKCNGLAQHLYRLSGFNVPETTRMWEADHPQESKFWDMAVIAYEYLIGDCVEDALQEAGE